MVSHSGELRVCVEGMGSCSVEVAKRLGSGMNQANGSICVASKVVFGFDIIGLSEFIDAGLYIGEDGAIRNALVLVLYLNCAIH